MNYDLIIIGAGPAALTAALYAFRYRLKTIVIGKFLGGVAGEAFEICNLPFFGRIRGFELMKKLIEQVKALGVPIKQEEVLEVSKINNGFKITTYKNSYLGKKIIIATGLNKRGLGVEMEKELLGKGISYCATCDAGFYKNKIVGVVGGGDSAMTSALLLSKYAKKIYILYRGSEFKKPEPRRLEQVKKNKKIKILFDSSVTKLIGKETLKGVELNGKKILNLDGLFIEIGSVPNIALTKKMEIKTEKDYIAVDKKQKTNIDGVFAAGDVTNNPLKQIITACSEGAVAANSAYRELNE